MLQNAPSQITKVVLATPESKLEVQDNFETNVLVKITKTQRYFYQNLNINKIKENFHFLTLSWLLQQDRRKVSDFGGTKSIKGIYNFYNWRSRRAVRGRFKPIERSLGQSPGSFANFCHYSTQDGLKLNCSLGWFTVVSSKSYLLKIRSFIPPPPAPQFPSSDSPIQNIKGMYMKAFGRSLQEIFWTYFFIILGIRLHEFWPINWSINN